ncbi:MAG: hypothetical protein ACE5NL_02455, partial [Candidatus Hydrothermarchaeaceae archaeon]
FPFWVKDMEIEEIKNLMKSLSLSDTEKKDQLNIMMLHSHIRWLEKHIDRIEARIDGLSSKEFQRASKPVKDIKYSSIINTPKRARMFELLLREDKVSGRRVAEYVRSDPNYVSYVLNQWVKNGILSSQSRGVFCLAVDEKAREYIRHLIEEVLG